MANLSLVPGEADLIATPAGWYHRSCVHEIPNGAHVDIHGLVRRHDGTAYQIPKCLHPGRVAAGGESVSAPVDNGWIEHTDYQSGSNLGEISATWRVPAAPTGSYCIVFCSQYQTYYSFPGLVIPLSGPSGYIIQPVMQFGSNGDFGGYHWTGSSWRCNDGSDCNHSTPIALSPGDSILGTATASACAGGICTWTISMVDVTKGTRSDYTIDDTQNYSKAVGGVVEVYNLTSCNQFPANGVFFTGISVYDQNHQQVSPAWHNVFESANGSSPNCDFAVTHTSTTANVYSNFFSVSISGPTNPQTVGDYTWTANPSGGFGGYTYVWERSDGSGYYDTGVTSQSYTGYIGKGVVVALRVTVTSGTGPAGTVHESAVRIVLGPPGCPNSPQGVSPNFCTH